MKRTAGGDADTAFLLALALAGSGVLWACLTDPSWMDGDTADESCWGVPHTDDDPNHGGTKTCPGITVTGTCKAGWERGPDGKCGCPRGYDYDEPTGHCRWGGSSGSGNPGGNPGDDDPGNGNPGGGNPGDDDPGDDWEDDDTVNFAIRMSCTGQGIRGSRITCTAETRNAKGKVSYEWRFSPRDGGPLVWDSGGAAAKLPAVTRTDTESGPTAEWAGIAVQGGTVEVQANDTAGGPPQSDFDTFDVWERGGSWTRLPTVLPLGRETPNFDRPYIDGDTIGDLHGYNADAATGDSLPRAVLQGKGSVWSDLVTDGPNTGYYYAVGHNYGIDRMWNLNSRIDTLGPREIPDAARGDTIDAWTHIMRNGGDPAIMRDGVAAHETFGHNGKNGHQGQLGKAMSTRACGAAASLAERIVAPDFDTAARLAWVIEENAVRAFATASSHHYVFGNVGSRAYYVVRDTVPDPDQFVFYSYRDVQKTKPIYPVFSPGWCDWTNF